MPDNTTYEYAIIRLVPIVEREEFINIGVILYSRKQKLLIMKSTIDVNKMKALDNNIDVKQINDYLSSWEKICNGEGGGIGDLEIQVRFRWLTANRSTIIQCSAVHSGLCSDPKGTLDKLFTRFVQ
jgi:hypothetical protein